MTNDICYQGRCKQCSKLTLTVGCSYTLYRIFSQPLDSAHISASAFPKGCSEFPLLPSSNQAACKPPLSSGRRHPVGYLLACYLLRRHRLLGWIKLAAPVLHRKHEAAAPRERSCRMRNRIDNFNHSETASQITGPIIHCTLHPRRFPLKGISLGELSRSPTVSRIQTALRQIDVMI